MADQAHAAHDDRPGILSNVIAVIAFIVVIAIVIWGLLHLAGISTSWFSSFFPRSAPSIQVTAPAQVDSGTAFSLTWKYSPSGTGTYAFLYQCRDGIKIQTQGVGGTFNTIPCGAAYTIPSTSNALFITPILTGTTTASIPLSIIFMPTASGSTQAQGSATVTIHAPAPIPQTETPVSPPSTSVPPKKTYSGPTDLSVRIMSVTPGDMATVQFDIANVGSSPSGTYHFSAYLPTTQGYTYYSPVQYSLAPGDHVVSTLHFSQGTGGTITVTLQPGGQDATSANNTASRSIAGNSASQYQYLDYAPTYQNQYDPYAQQYQYSPQYDYSQYPYQYGQTYYYGQDGGVQYLY